MPIVEEWEATGVRGLLGEGRTRPILLSCERGQVVREYVVKTESSPEMTPRSLFAEIVGSVMARRMGITTGDPALIRIGEQVSDAINDWMAGQKAGYKVEPGVGAGSAFVRLSPMCSRNNLTPDEVEQAYLVYAFDLLTQNPDRGRDRPNCARIRDGLFVYDFELCFSFLLALGGGPEPWRVGDLHIGRNHLFHPALSGKHRSIAGLRCALPQAGGTWIYDLCKQLPESWAQYGRRTSDHVRLVLSNTDRFISEVERSLA